MKKRTICIVLLIITLITLLSGCIKIEISTGIDEEYTAFLSYRIEMDADEIDVRYRDILSNALNRIGWHYQEYMDFSVQLDIENNPNVLVMTKKIQNNSFEQAYTALENLLKNEEMTPFMRVDMAFDSNERQDRYIISAETDISQIMRLSNYEELSPALQEQLNNALETGTGTIILTLPNSEIATHSHQINRENNQIIMDVPLSYTERTDFELSGVLNLLVDGSPGGSLNEITHELTRFRNMSIIICAAVVVLLLIILLLTKLPKKRR